MSLEQHPSNDELETMLQRALRAETPPGLTDAQRATLFAAGREPPTSRLRWKRFALLAVAAALPGAVYFGVVVPQAREEARVRAAQEEQAARTAELAADAERARQRAEEAQQRAREEALRVAERSAAACTPTAAAREEPPHKRAQPTRARASKPSAPSKAMSGGGCDPNDPLCGL